jgi:hypothetical protein
MIVGENDQWHHRRLNTEIGHRGHAAVSERGLGASRLVSVDDGQAR